MCSLLALAKGRVWGRLLRDGAFEGNRRLRFSLVECGEDLCDLFAGALAVARLVAIEVHDVHGEIQLTGELAILDGEATYLGGEGHSTVLRGVDSSTILYFVFASAFLAGEGNLVALERDLSELARTEDGFAEVELGEVDLTDAVEGDFCGSDRHLADGVGAIGAGDDGVGCWLGLVVFLATTGGEAEGEASEEKDRSPLLGIHVCERTKCDTMTEGKVPPYREQR